jgi:hypothetical protein
MRQRDGITRSREDYCDLENRTGELFYPVIPGHSISAIGADRVSPESITTAGSMDSGPAP